VNSFGSELNQVWTTIIDNAIDAMGGQGRPSCAVPYREGCLRRRLRSQGQRPGDSGKGFGRNIFEPFFYYQKRFGQGTGLGLDTAARIVRKHRGQIQVKLKGPATRASRYGFRWRKHRPISRLAWLLRL